MGKNRKIAGYFTYLKNHFNGNCDAGEGTVNLKVNLPVEHGTVVSYDTIRSWCNKLGPAYARTIRNRRGSPGDTWYRD